MWLCQCIVLKYVLLLISLCIYTNNIPHQMVPKEIRGRCGSFYQWLYTIGILLSYWIDYSVALHEPKTSRMWQIPIGLQLMSGGLLFFGTFTLPESTRWLLIQERPEEAWKALSWVRGDDSEKTVSEFEEIKEGLVMEQRDTEGVTYRELFKPVNRIRFFVGAMLFTFQNSTGSSALAVFGPQFFALLVGSSGAFLVSAFLPAHQLTHLGNNNLLLTGIFGAVKVIVSFTPWPTCTHSY